MLSSIMSTEGEGETAQNTNKRQKLIDDSDEIPVENGSSKPAAPLVDTAESNNKECNDNDIHKNSNLNNVIEENAWFTTGNKLRHEKLQAARKSWNNSEEFNDENLKLFQQPFKHGEIDDFVTNQDFVRGYSKLFSKLEIHEKASDLFQFNQSDDLNSLVDPHIFAISTDFSPSEYLKEKVLPFMKEVTGLPLNQTIDMFLSNYKQTDFLLCHDDELDSRRIAFIWYLSEDWKEEYGGTLDLFSSTDSFHPDQIQKKIVPKFNKFVFFEVGVTSFHQVSEVLEEGKDRLALSGWFYGEPLPRPLVQFQTDKSFNVLDSIQNIDGIFKKFCAEMYLNSEIYPEINEQLAEESEVLVPGFFRDDVYESICKSIVDFDISKSLFFSHRGPANIEHYEEALNGPPMSSSSNKDSGSSEAAAATIDTLRQFFYSKEFLDFLEKITEFPFTTCDTNRVTSALQKFSHGCYSLLRSGGTKQTGNKPSPDEVIDVAEEDSNLIDVMFFFANDWDECRGGSLIYLTTEGEQLITVPPEGNCLAVVVRSPNVNSYTNYVNCLAKEEVYFVYKMTFAFDGSI